MRSFTSNGGREPWQQRRRDNYNKYFPFRLVVERLDSVVEPATPRDARQTRKTLARIARRPPAAAAAATAESLICHIRPELRKRTPKRKVHHTARGRFGRTTRRPASLIRRASASAPCNGTPPPEPPAAAARPSGEMPLFCDSTHKRKRARSIDAQFNAQQLSPIGYRRRISIAQKRLTRASEKKTN